ncbi:MAG: hypothetical protein QM495_00255 [Lutibacter sp.]|uniref:hypothetical protein n=1 Tax=Lutibacter sp. TaxID=1925666 RepID=UPI00385E2E94
MSAGGHIMDMMNRIRQNAALKVSRRNTFKGNNWNGIFLKNATTKPKYDFPEVTDSELEIIKNEIKKEAAMENEKQKIIWILFIIAVVIILLFFIYY